MISRREIIAALATLGAARLVRAQVAQPPPGGRMRKLGVLMGLGEGDPEAQIRKAALEQGLRELGWEGGRNLRIDYRWADGDPDQIRSLARELVGLQPEIILAHTRPILEALRREQNAIPIVFALVSDPLGGGFVESLAHPGGNITGFAGFSFPIAGKWLDTLHEMIPGVAPGGADGESRPRPLWRILARLRGRRPAPGGRAGQLPNQSSGRDRAPHGHARTAAGRRPDRRYPTTSPWRIAT